MGCSRSPSGNVTFVLLSLDNPQQLQWADVDLHPLYCWCKSRFLQVADHALERDRIWQGLVSPNFSHLLGLTCPPLPQLLPSPIPFCPPSALLCLCDRHTWFSWHPCHDQKGCNLPIGMVSKNVTLLLQQCMSLEHGLVQHAKIGALIYQPN